MGSRLTQAAAIATLFPLAAQAQGLPTFCVNPFAPPQQVLACTLNALGGAVLSRRNNLLLGLDPGLDKQVDLLAFDRNRPEAAGSWPGVFNLGGPLAATTAGEPWERTSLLFRFSLAASLQQSADAGVASGLAGEGPPYALGMRARSGQAARPAFDLWAEGYFNRFDDQSGQLGSQGRSGVLYLGAEYRLSADILVGALVQFDRTTSSFDVLTSGSTDSGWMVGPYATVRLTDNLFLQARAAWGRAESKVRLDQNNEDHFDSDRWLVRSTLIGQWRSGSWQFRPRASVAYIEERQEGHVSSLGLPIPGQSASLGQAKLGPEVAYQHRLADGTVIEPSLLVEGIWNFAQNAGALKIDDLVVADELRARAEAGLTILSSNGLSFGGSVSYDGIGSPDYHAIGGKLRGRVPLN